LLTATFATAIRMGRVDAFPRQHWLR